MSGDSRRAGFEEGFQRAFALDDAVSFRRLMLDIYGGRCAVTGRLLIDSGQAEALEVFLFQPLDHGGAMSTANAVVVEPAVASLLGKGLILISDEFLAFTPHPEIIGAPSDPTGSRGRRLTLPDTVALWPERAMISYHRSLFRAQ